jgi:hypothetical protein
MLVEFGGKGERKENRLNPIYKDLGKGIEKIHQNLSNVRGRPHPLLFAAPEVIGKPEAQEKLEALIAKTTEDIEKTSGEYAKFGFKTWKDEWKFLFGDKQKLKEKPSFTEKLAHGLMMLLGWLIMAALLSPGAPFWHDALESLFGVKNPLRKRGDIKNVETVAGAGQPQT